MIIAIRMRVGGGTKDIDIGQMYKEGDARRVAILYSMTTVHTVVLRLPEENHHAVALFRQGEEVQGVI